MVERELPRLGRATFAGVPPHVPAGQAIPSRRAAVLGEHNAYVYSDLLGMRPEEIERLEDAEVIY